MMHFNCRCNPIITDQFKDAIHKWAKAKGVDPEHVFAANDWEKVYKETVSEIVSNAKRTGFRIWPDQPINTSVFEEALIVE